MKQLRFTSMPFLYPTFLNSSLQSYSRSAVRAQRWLQCSRNFHVTSTLRSNTEIQDEQDQPLSSLSTEEAEQSPHAHLDPAPSDYARSIFQDRCSLSLLAGSGGNGCVSFLREKYLEDGPANGGDGGTGGNVLIQAVEGERSLHKLARRRTIKAGRGKNGKGGSQGGQRGEDVVIQVPVGTVVREIGRVDPVAEEKRELRRLAKEVGKKEARRQTSAKRDRWVLYPGSQPSDFLMTDFPWVQPRQPDIAARQAPRPVYLDLSEPMSEPLLLAAGAVGGLGNPNFASKDITKPKFATTGSRGTRLELELELKLLADVGLVGLPNVGKSTLLRSLTNSRTRIGNWEFTTLSPNIGTVVLDRNLGRPLVTPTPGCPPRAHFTIADIPGVIQGAHRDKGLGLGFLRHIDRAGMLAFVVDLSAGDAVQALKTLWCELDEYQLLRESELNLDSEMRLAPWKPNSHDPDEPRVTIAGETDMDAEHSHSMPRGRGGSSSRNIPEQFELMYAKPWFVIATKADLPDTQENFMALRAYLAEVEKGTEEHPSRREHGWRDKLFSIPVSAMNAEGVDIIPEKIVRLLDGYH